MSGVSQTSTRATSPDIGGSLQGSFTVHSLKESMSYSTLAEENEETEANILEKTYAHELIYKEGSVMGGSLRALIEKLTAHQSTPDAMFVSTFYLTFRLFASPLEFAEALAERFEYIGDTPHAAGPVRLRVYNIFKGWLESHWRHDRDNTALDFIVNFASTRLIVDLPTAGKRLLELASKVSAVGGPLVPRLVSSMGKTNTSIAQYVHPDTPLPPAVLGKKEHNLLKQWKNGEASITILDFDPLELARQLTIKESRIFCSILPEELLDTEWTKKTGSLAVNVRAMSTLSTDLANLVSDSILYLEEPKKRAATIKHWVKIATKCLELNNYDSLMAIICSLNSSTISRLKKTWDIVSQKTKTALEQLRGIVDVSRNYAVLRQRLQNHVPPCLPFVGTYLTDLTFVDHGNQSLRTLCTDDSEMAVINFDKHMKTARIISELQRFQIPYRLTEVPELQAWMQNEFVRVRSNGETIAQNFYRRSLVLEPKEPSRSGTTLQSQTSQSESVPSMLDNAKDKFDFLSWTTQSKAKSVTTH
ncbi:Guanine-nucleotide dissociation stimulator CDC25 [Penicillium expansum]|nr:Guanine-nucleotide dissociation stimulator CDC25 [Penicillium expansum]